jgi:predicted RNA polymerase sigma factor
VANRDDSLSLLLLCCHLALTRPSQVALTLRAVAGLSTRQIARAFLVPEATMAQRISRAKNRLNEIGARFGVPSVEQLPDRVAATAQVLYLIFTEGHTSTAGAAL